MVSKALLPAHRDAGQVVTSRGTGIGTERAHHRSPFRAMRPDAAQTVQAVHDVVRHFMQHGAYKAIVKILGEQVGIVANTPFVAVHPVLAGGFTLEVESHRDGCKIQPANRPGALNTVECRREYLQLLPSVDRLYRYRQIDRFVHTLLININP